MELPTRPLELKPHYTSLYVGKACIINFAIYNYIAVMCTIVISYSYILQKNTVNICIIIKS